MSGIPRRVVRTSALVLSAVLLFACVDDNPGHFGDGDDPPGGDTATTETPTETPVPPQPSVPPLHPSVDDYPEALVILAGDDVDLEIAVKLADDAGRRAHGLMEVEALPDGAGMLFVFEEERDGGFWMKNTRVPLDIAYAGEDGEIHTILAMEPCQAEPCDVYEPDAAYRTALEVPQGWFADVGVAVGDTLDWEPLDDAR